MRLRRRVRETAPTTPWPRSTKTQLQKDVERRAKYGYDFPLVPDPPLEIWRADGMTWVRTAVAGTGAVGKINADEVYCVSHMKQLRATVYRDTTGSRWHYVEGDGVVLWHGPKVDCHLTLERILRALRGEEPDVEPDLTRKQALARSFARLGYGLADAATLADQVDADLEEYQQ